MSSNKKNIGNVTSFFQSAFIGLNNYVNSLNTIYTLVDGETLSESLPILGTIMVGYLTCVYGITSQYNSNVGTLSSDLFTAQSKNDSNVNINDYNYSKNEINKAYYKTLCTSTFVLFFLIIFLNKYIRNSTKGKSKRLKNMERKVQNIYKDIKDLDIIKNALDVEDLELNKIRNNDKQILQGVKRKPFTIDADIGNPQLLNSQNKSINIFNDIDNPIDNPIK